MTWIIRGAEHHHAHLPLLEYYIALTLVTKAINAGYTVSVNDGEEWIVHRSAAIPHIMAALGTTGEDWLRFRTAEGEKVGSVLLIWGNGRDVVSDHTDNAAMQALTNMAYTDQMAYDEFVAHAHATDAVLTRMGDVTTAEGVYIGRNATIGKYYHDLGIAELYCL